MRSVSENIFLQNFLFDCFHIRICAVFRPHNIWKKLVRVNAGLRKKFRDRQTDRQTARNLSVALNLRTITSQCAPVDNIANKRKAKAKDSKPKNAETTHAEGKNKIWRDGCEWSGVMEVLSLIDHQIISRAGMLLATPHRRRQWLRFFVSHWERLDNTTARPVS